MRPDYLALWNSMEIKSLSKVSAVADRLKDKKDVYTLVAEKFQGMPWDFVAVIHERESGQDWASSLAQGDPWNAVSTHVPKGRGPFASWQEAAIDALTLQGYSSGKYHWDIANLLENLELYNGMGYRRKGLLSPYLWSYSNHYLRGKYSADGHYDPNLVDAQIGCAPLLAILRDA